MVVLTDDQRVMAWLRPLKRSACIALGTRAALRTLPAMMLDGDLTLKHSSKHDIVISSLRAVLTASVSSVFADDDLKHAAFEAAKLAYSDRSTRSELPSEGKAFFASARSAYHVVQSAHSERFVTETTYVLDRSRDALRYSEAWQSTGLGVYSAFSRDASLVDQGVARSAVGLFEAPLWQDQSVESVFSDRWNKFVGLLEKDDPWKFWCNWLTSYVDGSPMDWDLQRRLALMPTHEWRHSPRNLANRVADYQKGERYIVANDVSKRLPIAEEIVLNVDTNKFDIRPEKIENEDFYDVTVDTVVDALNDAVENPSNGLMETSRAAVIIRRVNDRYRNNPQRVEMDFASIHGSLTRQVATQELPDSEDNLGLIRALRECTLSIRAAHKSIASNRKTLEYRAIAELSPKQRIVLRETVPILKEIAEGELHDVWSADVDYLLDTDTALFSVSPSEFDEGLFGRNEKIRIFGLAAKLIGIIKRSPSVMNAIDRHVAVKSAGVLGALYLLVQVGLTLL